jgi:hypothetical protein
MGDICSELEAWLPGGTGRRGSYDDLRDLVLRARDEILALRAGLMTPREVSAEEATWMQCDPSQVAAIRAEALEEAAQEVVRVYESPPDYVLSIAERIRALT